MVYQPALIVEGAPAAAPASLAFGGEAAGVHQGLRLLGGVHVRPQHADDAAVEEGVDGGGHDVGYPGGDREAVAVGDAAHVRRWTLAKTGRARRRGSRSRSRPAYRPTRRPRRRGTPGRGPGPCCPGGSFRGCCSRGTLPWRPPQAVGPIRLSARRGGCGRWSGRRDLNPRPSAWEADALPLSYSRLPRGLDFSNSVGFGQGGRCGPKPFVVKSASVWPAV